MPLDIFVFNGTVTHGPNGCTRNTHFAHKIFAAKFGRRKGVLYYDLGSRGAMTHSSCNRTLWSRRSPPTRAGTPVLGCTDPEFSFRDLALGTSGR